VQIPIDFIVPETQYPETLAGKVIVTPCIAPGMRVEVMLTAVDLDDEAVFETDENLRHSRCAGPDGGSGIPVFSMSVDEPTTSPLAESFACEGCERFR